MNVMKRAWEIAKEGQKKFGGKVKEYFAQALRMAWIIVKKGMELVELQGSEKQVKWANDIRSTYLSLESDFKATYEDLASSDVRHFDLEAHASLKRIFDMIKDQNSASAWISSFSTLTKSTYKTEVAKKVALLTSLKDYFYDNRKNFSRSEMNVFDAFEMKKIKEIEKEMN